MKKVFKANGMNKAEIAQMSSLFKKSQQPDAALSSMQLQKLEMIRQMMDAETKKLDKCAVLVQSCWRGILERRLISAELLRMRYRTQLARDSTMVTTISRVYRGHVARRFLRYALRHIQRNVRLGRVVRTEGETRNIVQRRIEAKKRQLDIAVTLVQRMFRGHLGRRRFAAQHIFRWELQLHLAAKKIQAMYRDRIDRQWADYVNKGNLQVLNIYLYTYLFYIYIFIYLYSYIYTYTHSCIIYKHTRPTRAYIHICIYIYNRQQQYHRTKCG